VVKQPAQKSEQQSFKPTLTLKQQASAKEMLSNPSEGASYAKLTTVKESTAEPNYFEPFLEKPGDKTQKSAVEFQNTSVLSAASVMQSIG
jgi:hypothetical protein